MLKNGGDFIKDVRSECGVNIRLLTGQQEARSAFFAAALPGGECGVIDIGGASTEMIWRQRRGCAQHIRRRWARSG